MKEKSQNCKNALTARISRGILRKALCAEGGISAFCRGKRRFFAKAKKKKPVYQLIY